MKDFLRHILIPFLCGVAVVFVLVKFTDLFSNNKETIVLRDAGLQQRVDSLEDKLSELDSIIAGKEEQKEVINNFIIKNKSEYEKNLDVIRNTSSDSLHLSNKKFLRSRERR